MAVRYHLLFWGLLAGLSTLFVVAFKSILLPFILGIAVAYLLNPVVNKIVNAGLPRTGAVSLILSVFVLFITGLMVLIVPLIYKQTLGLAEELPELIERLRALAAPYVEKFQDHVSPEKMDDIQSAVGGSVGSIVAWMAAFVGKLLSSGIAIVGFISIIILTPVVAFYLMRDWPEFTGKIAGWLPRKHAATIRDLLAQMDERIAGFIRGQLTVCVVLGLVYAIALTIAGLKFGFVIGLGAGILSIIPYVGSIVGFFVGIGMAWVQFGAWEMVAIVAAIFFAGQILEGNFLTPKLVGESVGLHPVWIIFALMGGGALFGLTGMFLAVPVAAVVDVMLGFGLQQYLASAYYGGGAEPENETDAKQS